MDNELSDLMDCFDLLCDEGKGDILSYCDSRRVFPQNWLWHRLSNVGLLEVTGVHFDVFDILRLFRADDSVPFDTESVVSDVTGDENGIPMTTAARSWGGDSGCSEWLNFESAYTPAFSSRTGGCG